MTVTTLIEAIALEFGENPQDGDVVAALLGMIKDVVQDINLQGEWKHTKLTTDVNTVASTPTVDLPNTVGSIIAIQRPSTGRSLQYVNIERLTDGSLILTNEGEPAFWNFEVIADGVPTLRLYPTPDAIYTYKVYYESSTDDITDESSTLSLPNDFIPTLKHGVRVMYYAATGDQIQVSIYQTKFNEGIRRLRGRHEHLRRDEQMMDNNDIDRQTVWPTPQFPSYYPRIG